MINEPRLKYTPTIAYQTIAALLGSDVNRAAQAWQTLIDSYAYPELFNMGYEYSGMADFYARAGNKAKGAAAMEKAIEVMKSRNNFSATDLRKYEEQLLEYKKM